MSDTPRRPALDPATLEGKVGSRYPEQFRKDVGARSRKVLGDPVGLTDFGVNLLEIPPGAASALRHWHTDEDEFVYVLEGDVTLITNEGEQVLKAGHAAGFPKGAKDGHHLVNRSDRTARILEVGSRNEKDAVHYPDVDLHLGPEQVFTNKKGEAYE